MWLNILRNTLFQATSTRSLSCGFRLQISQQYCVSWMEDIRPVFGLSSMLLFHVVYYPYLQWVQRGQDVRREEMPRRWAWKRRSATTPTHVVEETALCNDYRHRCMRKPGSWLMMKFIRHSGSATQYNTMQSNVKKQKRRKRKKEKKAMWTASRSLPYNDNFRTLWKLKEGSVVCSLSVLVFSPNSPKPP